ncbi:hypothetical protein MASR2M15_21000 [Anaerolineales bacterium]
MKRIGILLIMLSLALAACSSPGSEPTETTTSNDQTTASKRSETFTAAPFADLTLTNAISGKTFTFADFAGKTVYVHPMAQWCTNCRNSQRRLRDEVLPILGENKDIVFVSLDIEFSTSESLANYANDERFDWVFAVVSPEFQEQLIDTFGRSVIVAPGQPHFIIRPDGSYTELLTGNPPADQTIALIELASQ